MIIATSKDLAAEIGLIYSQKKQQKQRVQTIYIEQKYSRH